MRTLPLPPQGAGGLLPLSEQKMATGLALPTPTLFCVRTECATASAFTLCGCRDVMLTCAFQAACQWGPFGHQSAPGSGNLDLPWLTKKHSISKPLLRYVNLFLLSVSIELKSVPRLGGIMGLERIHIGLKDRPCLFYCFTQFPRA